jgi:hypothetical protein
MITAAQTLKEKAKVARSSIRDYLYTQKGRNEINVLLSEINAEADIISGQLLSLVSHRDRDITYEEALVEGTGYSETTITVSRGSVNKTDIQLPAVNTDFNMSVSGTTLEISKKSISFKSDYNYPVTFYITYLDGYEELTAEVSTAYINRDSSKDPTLYGANADLAIDVQVDGSVKQTYTFTFDEHVTTVYVVPSRGVRSLNNKLNDSTFNQSHLRANDLRKRIGGSVSVVQEDRYLSFDSGHLLTDLPDRCIIISGIHEYACIRGILSLVKGFVPSGELASGVYGIRTETLTLTNDVNIPITDSEKEESSAYVSETNLDRGDIIISENAESEIIKSGLGSEINFIDKPTGIVFSSRRVLTNALSLVDTEPPIFVEDIKRNESSTYDLLEDLDDFLDDVIQAGLTLVSLPVRYPILLEVERMHNRLGYDRALDLLKSLSIDEYESLTEEQGSYIAYLADSTKTLQVKVMQ